MEKEELQLIHETVYYVNSRSKITHNFQHNSADMIYNILVKTAAKTLVYYEQKSLILVRSVNSKKKSMPTNWPCMLQANFTIRIFSLFFS